MMRTGRSRPRRAPLPGFTLVELLVVVLIIVLVGAATIKVAIFDQGGRSVSEGARVVQAAIAGARDAAFRSNSPRGIRFLPDPVFNGQNGGALAANRIISIETAPDYNTGLVSVTAAPNDSRSPRSWRSSSPYSRVTTNGPRVPVTTAIPNEPTSWYWNIRVGDKIRFGDSGRYYTVAGPNLSGAYLPPGSQFNSGATYVPYNVERYVNFGPPGYVRQLPIAIPAVSVQNNPDPTNAGSTHFPEFLQVVNGQDDDGDGWIDEGFDGIDNDGDGIIDPGYNGIDDDGVNGIDDPGELT